MIDPEEDDADTLEVIGEPKSSARILAAIKKAERAFHGWQALCDGIDEIYDREEDESVVISDGSTWADPDYDLFWSSTEVLQTAIYARPPQPVVSPQFKDRRPLKNTTVELLERTVASTFGRTNLDEAMCAVRDDLIFYNRGQLWCTYETDKEGGGQRVSIEHLDRKDFLHPPARIWGDVPWVARRAWMTRGAMRKRFRKMSGDAYKDANFARTERDDDGGTDHSRKAGVWELWHKAERRVYWVAEGVGVILDEDEPHLDLDGFFPCPRPAYGTLKRRTLLPRPDYVRYAPHFRKINALTRRVYALLDMVQMKGLIPAGGDVGNAVEQLMRETSSDSILIPVPAAAMIADSSGAFVQWLPLADIAAAITGLIEARRELFADYDRLSGISDIMRGETEAEETLGAQRLKSQYGSVRVRGKIGELQRIARDVTRIVAEIAAEKFSSSTLLAMAQMEIPTEADIARRMKAVEDDAREAMEAATKKAQAAGQSQDVDPAQVRQQFEQARQQIVDHFGPIARQIGDEVPIEDVMKLLRDDKARGFAFEVETDSTILTDEMQEKASRNEFLTVFSGATQGLMSLAALGEPGAKLAGEVLKFALQPYRVGRELNSIVDEFIDAAPQMAAAASQGANGEDSKAIAEANTKLAEAEMAKAKASIMKVQADAAYDQAESQRKMSELQGKIEKERAEFQLKVADAQGKATEAATKAELLAAQVDKLRAETAKILNSIGLDERKQQLDEYTAATDAQMKATDQAMAADRDAADAQFRAEDGARADREQAIGASQSSREGERADRQQDFAERQGERVESRADRQQRFSERQADREHELARSAGP